MLRALTCALALSLFAGCGDDDDGEKSGEGGASVACTDVHETLTPTGCTMYYESCSDGQKYRVDCSGNQPYACQCVVNDSPTGLFDHPDLCVLNGSIERGAVSQGCGWKLK